MLRRVLVGLRRGVRHAERTDGLPNVPVIPEDVIVICRRPSEIPIQPAKNPPCSNNEGGSSCPNMARDARALIAASAFLPRFPFAA